MIKALVDLIDKHKKPNMVVCEIGVWQGQTTKEYLPIVKKNNGRTICIDWFKGNADITTIPDHPHAYQPNNQFNILNSFLNNVKEYLDYINIIIGDSKLVSQYIPNESIDICFIDGDHIYPNIKQDIELYLSKVKPGGILAGHDMENINLANTFTSEQLYTHYYNGVHPGVIQAVYDNFQNNIEVINDPHGDLIPIWVKYK